MFCNVCRLRLAIADFVLLGVLDNDAGIALAGAIGFGGPGAIATTPPCREFGSGGLDDVVDFGDSDSGARCCVICKGALTREFFRETFFDERALLIGIAPLPLFRFLMTSVFSDSGRTTPCSFRKRPHALHSGLPSGLRRHRGVVCVKQFEQVVGWPLLSVLMSGLPGRVEAAVLKPAQSCGELGEVWGLCI